MRIRGQGEIRQGEEGVHAVCVQFSISSTVHFTILLHIYSCWHELYRAGVALLKCPQGIF